MAKYRTIFVRILRVLLSLIGINTKSKFGVSTKAQLLLISKFGLSGFLNARKYLKYTQAQLGQDLFILLSTDFKRNGYFVEFGATNGITLSNTYLLETHFSWSGILAEPAKMWESDLKLNRKANISNKAVWKESNISLEFEEYPIGELSTISQFKLQDENRDLRVKPISYDVQTITLLDLLEDFGAPRNIDVVSIDTEGSEYEILKEFDFKKYEVNIFIIEHAFSENERKIDKLLRTNGYDRKLKELSRWDAWYIKYSK